MRIVMCGTELAPLRRGAGGLENVVCTWATALTSAGDDVHLASLDPSRPAGDGAHNIATVGELHALVDRLRPDLVHINNRPGLARSLASSGSTVPTLVTLHNHLDALDAPPASATGPGAPHLTAVSAYLAGYYRGHGVASDIAVTTPGIEEGLAGPALVPSERRLDVLVAGRLLVKKGIERVPAIAGHPRLAHLTFGVTRFLSPWAEPTAEHRSLDALLAAVPNVTMIEPPPSRVAYGRLLASSRVVLLPAVWDEPFGMVSIEAQAVGTRVVCADRGGLPETLVAGSVAVDIDDIDAVADALLAAVADPVPPALARIELDARFSGAASAGRLRDVLLAAAGSR